MARAMIVRTLDAGVPCAWVLADALYGSDSGLRRLLETRGQPYVLAVRSNHPLRFLSAGTRRRASSAGLLVRRHRQDR
jgi:SRSO17 transposase